MFSRAGIDALVWIVVIAAAATPVRCLAESGSEDAFEALDKLLDENFETIDRSLEAQYELMDQAMENAYQRLGEAVERQWGAGDVELPTKKAWVDYTDDLKTRRVIDFEHGTIRLERIIDIADGSEAIIRDMVEAAHSVTKDTVADLADKDLALGWARQALADEGVEMPPQPASDSRPVLADVAAEVASARIEGLVEKAITSATGDADLTPEQQPDPPLRAEVKTLDGNKRKVSIQVPFISNHTAKLANRYIDRITEEADRQDLPPSLLLAVMETESSFNPRATSPIPAYGLMQLVPSSGAMDAYQYVYGEKTLLGPDYLYDPNQNVELGSAYLGILNNRYLRHIADPETRELCAIAAYNTGAGNVARAFVGTNDVRAAARVINEMTTDEVYNYLRENLPYEETRRYVYKVTEAQKKYFAFDGAGL